MVSLDDFRTKPDITILDLQSQESCGILGLVMELYDMHCEYEDNTPQVFRTALAGLRKLNAATPTVIPQVYELLDANSRRYAQCDDSLAKKYAGAANFLRMNLNLQIPKTEAPTLEQRVN